MIDEVRIAVDRLRLSWSWLQELTEPGRETRSGRVLSDADRERLDKLAEAEYFERYPKPRWDAARGLWRWPNEDPAARSTVPAGGSAAKPAPARLSVLDAQAEVLGIVLEVVRRVTDLLDCGYVGNRYGLDPVVQMLDWLDGGPGRWVVDTQGCCWAMPPRGVLAPVIPPDEINLIMLEELLLRADSIARVAAGVFSEYNAPIYEDCPACGRRSLVLQHDGDRRHHRYWTVRCISASCVCKGKGCTCRRAVQYQGRRHVWACDQLHGAWGLWAAIARTRRQTPPVRSTRVGHGGWPERSRKGAA